MTALEMFNKFILPIMSAQNAKSAIPAITAINVAIDYLSKELISRKSNLVQDSYSATITAGSNSAQLPADFYGFMGRPIANYTTELDPLAAGERVQYIGWTGSPERYEEKAGTIIVYPTSTTDTTLTAEYWAKPADLNGMSDVIPFSGMFDRVIADASIKIAIGGMGVVVNADFVAEVKQGIDQVLFARSKPLPNRRFTQYF